MHCFSWTVQSLFDLPPVSTINALKSWVGSHVCGYHATHSIPIMGSLFIYTAGYAFSWKPAMAQSGSLICSWNLLVKKLANFLIAKKKAEIYRLLSFYGADEGNWTPVSALARLCSTIELHLHNWRSRWDSNPRSPPWQGGMLTTTPLDLQLVLPQCLYIIPRNFILDK